MGTSTLLIILSVALGSIFMGVALAVVLIKDEISPGVAYVVRGIFSMGTGFASAGILGTITFNGPVLGVTIIATGSLAVTAMFWLLGPTIGLRNIIAMQNVKFAKKQSTLDD